MRKIVIKELGRGWLVKERGMLTDKVQSVAAVATLSEAVDYLQPNVNATGRPTPAAFVDMLLKLDPSVNDHRIDTIKLIRSATGCGLKEALEATEVHWPRYRAKL